MSKYIPYEEMRKGKKAPTNEELIDMYIAFKEKEKRLKDDLKLMREDLLDKYPEGNTLEGPYMVAVSSSQRTRLSSPSVREQFPEVYKQCSIVSPVTTLKCYRVEE